MDRNGSTIPLIRSRAESQEAAGLDASFTKLATSGDKLLEMKMAELQGEPTDLFGLLDHLISHAAMAARLIERFSPELRDKLAHKDYACRAKIMGKREHCGVCE